MERDLLKDIARCIQQFDTVFGCSTSADFTINRAGVVTPVSISKHNGYTIVWGKPPPVVFLPPPPGQTRLTVDGSKKLIYKKRKISTE